jgi:hypothetical protein
MLQALTSSLNSLEDRPARPNLQKIGNGASKLAETGPLPDWAHASF